MKQKIESMPYKVRSPFRAYWQGTSAESPQRFSTRSMWLWRLSNKERRDADRRVQSPASAWVLMATKHRDESLQPHYPLPEVQRIWIKSWLSLVACGRVFTPDLPTKASSMLLRCPTRPYTSCRKPLEEFHRGPLRRYRTYVCKDSVQH